MVWRLIHRMLLKPRFARVSRISCLNVYVLAAYLGISTAVAQAACRKPLAAQDIINRLKTNTPHGMIINEINDCKVDPLLTVKDVDAIRGYPRNGDIMEALKPYINTGEPPQPAAPPPKINVAPPKDNATPEQTTVSATTVNLNNFTVGFNFLTESAVWDKSTLTLTIPDANFNYTVTLHQKWVKQSLLLSTGSHAFRVQSSLQPHGNQEPIQSDCSGSFDVSANQNLELGIKVDKYLITRCAIAAEGNLPDFSFHMSLDPQ